MGSIGQLHFDSSISELRYLASKTIFSDSPFARMITELMKVLPFGCSSLFQVPLRFSLRMTVEFKLLFRVSGKNVL